MFFVISFIFSILLIVWFILEQNRHFSKINKLKYRIHVNGIRGKSSVTRLLAGVLREAKYNTIGKSTGTDTNIITTTGEDLVIKRRGPANVFENVRAIQNFVTDEIDAVVIECMAIQPRYQRFLEEKVMKANISIITNVREDHVAEMGYTLEDIAHSLSATIPTNGYLICSEENERLQDILKNNCKEKGTKYINALDFKVSERYLTNFHYVEHKENIAIGLALADLLNIPEKTALAGMKKVLPDRGATVIKKYELRGKKYIWVNLFAANDRQSVIKNVDMIHGRFPRTEYATTSLLNNRTDRPERAQQFVDIVTKDIKSDYVVTIGDLEKQVVHGLNKNKHKNIIALAKHSKATGKDLITRIGKAVEEDTILLLGLGNIHTTQAESILLFLQQGAREVR
jgi:poly-gamma-glutamate synthase PgsB/CapB